MEVLFERVAGLDIGKASLSVCVRTPGPGGRRSSQTRTFKSTTRALQVMRDWLLAEGVTIAAMESTSTYWKGAFYCLEEVLEVWLLNAAHMKAVPGRKTDVKDAEWIAQLLEHGLLRPSFVPPPDIRRLRMLTRYRVQLMGDRTREATRLEGMLEDASIKLSVVASSLTTVSARAMLAALIDGERDARVLAELAKGKMRAKIPELTEALIGHFDAGHAELTRSILGRLDAVEADLADLDAVIATACRPWAHQIQLLQTIPGVGEKVAQVILAETGGDMSRFPSAAHLAAWAGVAPAVYESAGKRSPTGARHGNKWLTTMLVEAAAATARMKGVNYLSAQHARLTARRGTGRAQVAVAHSILVSACWMLTRDEPFQELGADWLARRNERRTLAGWSPSSNAWGTPWSSTPPPDRTGEELEDGLRPPRADARPQHPYSRVCDVS
ncbi:IS110 family transposase [Blastococcus sp. TF02-8]|uniref:IS110 family transposase n=1 Tax=Blastococcus sp. TF02-8 TaxID=2250574 RepID=UPI00197ACF03|nr:IS110 family transposase [Blastococcus sp. TF02-8]